MLFFISARPHYHKVWQKADLMFEYEIEQFRMLDFGGLPCSQENHDSCSMALLRSKLMKQVGCTPPFFEDKSAVCTNGTEGVEAMNIYNKFLNNPKEHCLNPCHFSMFRFTMGRDTYLPSSGGKQQSRLQLRFRQKVKVTDAVKIYDGFSMVAEIGGLVGIFLGMSVAQVSDVVDKCLLKQWNK